MRTRRVMRALLRCWRPLALACVVSCADTPSPSAPVPKDPDPPSLSAPNVAPTAQFAVSPRWPAVGDTVTFDARYSHDTDGQVAYYKWAFSNGITNTTGQVTREVFKTAGTYTVTLTTYDDTGDSTSTTLSLPVGPSGTPTGAVDAAQSRLVLSAGTTSGGTSVTATVTAKTAAGVVISGLPVAIAASGLRVAASPVTGTTNGSGVWTSSLSSGKAQSVVVRAVANFTALTDTVPLTITNAPVVATSGVRISQTALTALTDSALVEVTARDSAGNPVSGAAVTLTGSPSGLTITNTGTTDANGRRVMTVKATFCGIPYTLTAVAGGVTLTTQPSLQLNTAVNAYTVCAPNTWLDATDATTFTTESGSRVTQWRDKSGNARHANATSGSTMRPTYSATGFHGRASVLFAGGANNTTTPQHMALSSYPGASQSAMTYFIVFNMATSNFCSRLFDFGTSSATSYVYYASDCFGNRYVLGTSGSGSEVSVGAGPAIATNVGAVSTIQHASSAQLRTNGALILSVASLGLPSVIGATPPNVWFGRSQYSADGYYGGYIGEFLAFPRTLSAAEYTAVEKALMLKWGLGTMTIVQGNSQSATAGTAPSVDPQVRITDAAGTGLAGATVTWQVTSGGGRVNGGTTLTATTDATGYVSVPNGTWKLDYGTNTLTLWYSSTAGQGQSVVFTGTGTLPTNLVMQYDANNTSSLYRASNCTGTLAAVGDSVGCWKDLTTNARHVTQGTAANRPTVTTFGSTGRAALQFVKTRENYLESTATGIDALANGPRTIVAVAKGNTSEDNVTNNGGGILLFPGFHSGLHFFNYPTMTTVVGEQWRSTSTLLWSDVTYTPNTAMVASQVVSTTGGSLSNTVTINGTTSQTTSTSGLTSPSYPNLMRVGQGNATPTTDYRWRLDGQIAEILVFSRALTNAERLQAERYLGWKWGVTVP